MSELKGKNLEYWQHYCREKNVAEDTYVEAGMAGNSEITDGLLHLYLQGKKTAGSGLVQDYKQSGDPLPKIGNHWIILDAQQNPRCIVKTIAVEFHLFKDIPLRIAIAEGEGDSSLEYWRKGHRIFFSAFLADLGIDDLDEAEIVTEFFELVWK
ncbi:ASCH domain-containing protein [Candidatus Uabimicrobium amorphum]|nr:ASCH domain-containing protein [Candidatus Uabimicrobium amorphum]